MKFHPLSNFPSAMLKQGARCGQGLFPGVGPFPPRGSEWPYWILWAATESLKHIIYINIANTKLPQQNVTGLSRGLHSQFTLMVQKGRRGASPPPPRQSGLGFPTCHFCLFPSSRQQKSAYPIPKLNPCSFKSPCSTHSVYTNIH